MDNPDRNRMKSNIHTQGQAELGAADNILTIMPSIKKLFTYFTVDEFELFLIWGYQLPVLKVYLCHWLSDTEQGTLCALVFCHFKNILSNYPIGLFYKINNTIYGKLLAHIMRSITILFYYIFTRLWSSQKKEGTRNLFLYSHFLSKYLIHNKKLINVD